MKRNSEWKLQRNAKALLKVCGTDSNHALRKWNQKYFTTRLQPTNRPKTNITAAEVIRNEERITRGRDLKVNIYCNWSKKFKMPTSKGLTSNLFLNQGKDNLIQWV